MSEQTDGTLGKRETARAAFSGHRAMEAGWPTISTDGAMCRMDLEADRLLCDDGRTLPWRPTAGKAQRDRRVEGWARYRSACRIAYEARRSWERFEFL